MLVAKGGIVMNRIITVGRQFGSGGRELGKRLADELGCPYYDKDIIREIAARTQLAESYIQQILEHRPNYFFPITIGRTLHNTAPDYLLHQHTSVYTEQVNTIREMAEKSDCVIVGRCADHILREFKPFRLFVYADMDSRMERCRKKAPEDEALTDKELKKKILRVDRNRAKYYRYYTGHVWGRPANYDFCINTSWVNLKAAAHALAHMITEEPQP